MTVVGTSVVGSGSYVEPAPAEAGVAPGSRLSRDSAGRRSRACAGTSFAASGSRLSPGWRS